MNRFTKVMIFAVGVTIGSVVTWKLIDRKYKDIAQEEIDSVKEVFSKRQPLLVPTEEAQANANKAKDKPNIGTYSSRLQEEGYLNYTEYSNTKSEEVTDEMKFNNRPYIISPEAFGEEDDYDTVSLTYYADHFLTDDDNQIINEVDDVVGLESLESFGEYEDDSVFVRNDVLKTDYEILLDQRKYFDVIRRKPHEVDD